MRFYNSFLVSFSIVRVTCMLAFVSSASDSQDRDRRFREKYCGKQYTAWTRMQETDNITLANICFKYFSFDKEGTEGAAEAHKMINITADYGRFDEVTLDMICCKIRYRNVRDKVTGEGIYYLAEGNDDDSAYKLFLTKQSETKFRIILGGEVRPIWNLTIDPSAKLGSKSMLDLDIYRY